MKVGEYRVMVYDTMESMSLDETKEWCRNGNRNELEYTFKYFMENEMFDKASIIYNML